MPILVQCENTDCKRMFPLTSPEDIATAILIDENDEEVDYVKPEEIFFCPTCMEKYAFETDDGED